MPSETFTLHEEQVEKLKLWQEFIYSIHGKYGLFEYRFVPTGIGLHVTVYSKLAKVSIDLSEYEKW